MMVVYTKEGLEKAFKAKERNIVVKGDLAKTIKSKYDRKRRAKVIGGALVMAGSVLTIPFTGGLSIVAGATTALTIGSVVISTAELAILVGGGLAFYGIHNKCKVTFNSDGSVTIESKE